MSLRELMDNGFLIQLKSFLARYKYLIVVGLFLVVILVASDNSLVKRMVLKRQIRDLQEQLRESSELKQRNELLLNDLNNDTTVTERIARERYNMHRADEDLFIEQD